MSSTTFSRVAERPLATTEAQRIWRIAAIALLSIRIIQGFVYWGGGSRRFIYAPSKLDPSGGHSWMANKFQTAMPGALLGMDHVISFMLQHFYVLYAGVILFSAAELVVGFMLMTGLMIRVSALASMGFSVLLMLMFGWQGATCIDEWTMAACNLAMGTTLLLGGGGAYSLDNVLLRRNYSLADRPWFRWTSGSLPLPQTDAGFQKLAFGLLAFVLVFNIGTYSYYRGSVITPLHSGPVSPTKHHLALSQAMLLPDGGVRFHVYLDGGTPEAPVHVVAVDLLDSEKHICAHWDAAHLAELPKASFENDYAYNKFGSGPFGIRAPMGAAATVTLPAVIAGYTLDAKLLRLTDVDGQAFTVALQKARIAPTR
jgi:thiosulfate dehydrogenase (quinone)